MSSKSLGVVNFSSEPLSVEIREVENGFPSAQFVSASDSAVVNNKNILIII